MLSHIPAETQRTLYSSRTCQYDNDNNGVFKGQLVCLTVEVEDGLTADWCVRQNQRFQTLQPVFTQLRCHLQAKVGNSLQLQHLQVSAAPHCTQHTYIYNNSCYMDLSPLFYPLMSFIS